MVSAVNTGTPLQGGTVNSPGNEQQSQNTFFNSLSSNTLSHKFIVHESPYLISGYGIDDSIGIVEVVKVTETSSGEILESLHLNGRLVALTFTNNTLLIDLPGTYRLRCLDGGNLGNFTVVGQQTAMSYWSWNLAAYANAVDQTSNAQNPEPPP